MDKQEQIMLTYKGPKQKDDYKKRQEIEIPLVQPEAMRTILSALGFKSALIVEKHRRIWRVGECLVALDQLPVLGTFVEIEGPADDNIAAVQKDLGLSGIAHISESYACLVRAQQSRKT